MAAGRHVYGYMGLGREDEYLTTGLWNATTQYMLAKVLEYTHVPVCAGAQLSRECAGAARLRLIYFLSFFT